MIADRRRSRTSRLKRAAAQLRGLVPGRQLRRRPRHPRLLIALLVLAIGVLTGGWLWLRDSSLVSVKQVRVTGATGPDAGQISQALATAARRMTTLDVDLGRLRAAVAGYPVVAGLRVSTHLPHRLQVRVIERIPVGTATVNGRQTAVSADGMLLPDVSVGASRPGLTGAASARDGRVAGAYSQQQVALLAAAPNQLLAKISQVSVSTTHGLTAQIRGGPALYFGEAAELNAKWVAATEVLADPGSAGAAYIDVTEPHRPAAGIGSDSAAASGSAGTTVAPTAGTTTAAPGPATSPSTADSAPSSSSG